MRQSLKLDVAGKAWPLIGPNSWLLIICLPLEPRVALFRADNGHKCTLFLLLQSYVKKILRKSDSFRRRQAKNLSEIIRKGGDCAHHGVWWQWQTRVWMATAGLVRWWYCRTRRDSLPTHCPRQRRSPRRHPRPACPLTVSRAPASTTPGGITHTAWASSTVWPQRSHERTFWGFHLMVPLTLVTRTGLQEPSHNNAGGIYICLRGLFRVPSALLKPVSRIYI